MANASDSDSEDWGFESLRVDQNKKAGCCLFFCFLLREGTRNEVPNFEADGWWNSGEQSGGLFDNKWRVPSGGPEKSTLRRAFFNEIHPCGRMKYCIAIWYPHFVRMISLRRWVDFISSKRYGFDFIKGFAFDFIVSHSERFHLLEKQNFFRNAWAVKKTAITLDKIIKRW